jgi:hypothetical protein
VLRVIYAFVDILLHRRGPDHLPASRFFFALVLITAIVVSLFTIQFSAIPSERFVPIIVVDIGFSLAFTWCVLRAFGVERRFLQTAAATLGAGSLLDLASLPFALWHRALSGASGEVTLPYVIYLLIALVWLIDVSSFIMARAIARPYVLGLAIVIGYALLSVSLEASLFPAPR